ncbi:fumarylacetoacetate hydrolase family protein [Sphingobium sp.]|uniref:2-keto-4-pentenoate hydratase n=1 Tax=Sphingobium TaxID=165695 RepID=UPI001A218ED6|nr:fumarylacetoacetate hydrolase family protein [Sphingobium sp.]MBJ7376647.1 fumarylacetoacetate hydrolase family protein [Sphingobium sp.]
MVAVEIAASFVAARRRGHGLAKFPGLFPLGLEDAYAIQLAAIELWPDAIAGWKVGRLSPALADRFGKDRFVGPVFAGGVIRLDKSEEADFPVFVGGSAAFEAEYVMVLDKDQPSLQTGVDIDQARRLVGEVRIGVEVAGSPLAIMPHLDALASIADLGNNNGQIVGPAVPLDLLSDPRAMTCATSIDGVLMRSATAADLPGGPLTALAFALDQCARLGFPLKAGQFVSTGAVTGMHWVRAGQHCVADFGRFGKVACLAVPVGRA